MAPRFACANWSSDQHLSCKKDGKLTCKGCRLVLYCGAECQKAHWPVHKLDCRSSLRRESWRPDWGIENRTPAFIGNDMPHVFGTHKYLWGNMPAYDLLKLKDNEGEAYDGVLKILVAASGDVRNVVKTVADLPKGYTGKLEMVVNDYDVDIVARNVIILLIMLASGDDERDVAVDVIIHFWYSALLRKSDMDFLRSKIKPLVQHVCDKISGKNPRAMLAKEWVFGHRSMRVVLQKSTWDKVLSYLDVVPGVTPERAHDIRVAVTLAPSRKDFIHRYFCCIGPSTRVAAHRFRKDGLLLPFGASTAEFQVPNPSFFRNGNEWVMMDSADPQHGWPSKGVAETSSGAATGDIYGKLFYYLRATIGEALGRPSTLETRFRLFQVNAEDLPDYLGTDDSSFCRVSNITDGAWLGTPKVLAFLAPMLQKPAENKHATLIALYMNAVIESETFAESTASMQPYSDSGQLALKFVPMKGAKPRNDYDPSMIRFLTATKFTTRFDTIFKRYMKLRSFSEMGLFMGAEIKDKHTVIEKWPFTVKVMPGYPGAQEDFDRLLGSGNSGKERYVEWKRTT